EALGYELIGNRETAHALATELRKEFPHVVRLLAIWLRTAPENTPIATLTETAGGMAKDDEELNLAWSYRALAENRIGDAMSFGRRATELDADSPQAWLALAQAKHMEGYAGATIIQAAPLREAEQHYDRAVQLARDQKMSGLEAMARFNRG